jgi:hypothetical protein
MRSGADFNWDGNTHQTHQTRFVDVGGGDASGHSGFTKSAPARPSARRSGCNGRGGDRKPPYRVFANQLVVVDRTKPAGRILTSVRVKARGAEALTLFRRQLAITSFTCMIGSIFV